VGAEVLSVNVSSEKGTRKRPVERARAVSGFGIAGDAHGGEGHRQVSLLARESIDKIAALASICRPGTSPRTSRREASTSGPFPSDRSCASGRRPSWR